MNDFANEQDREALQDNLDFWRGRLVISRRDVEYYQKQADDDLEAINMLKRRAYEKGIEIR